MESQPQQQQEAHGHHEHHGHHGDHHQHGHKHHHHHHEGEQKGGHGGHEHHHHPHGQHQHGGHGGGCGSAGGPRGSKYKMLPVPEAIEVVLANTPSEGAGTVEISLQNYSLASSFDGSIEDVLGLILEEDVVAKDPLPPFRASIMDGYAVVAADGPGDYPVVARVMAGTVLSENFRLESGQVTTIMTGAALPPGADAVVMVERTELLEQDPETKEERRVRILKGVREGENVRPIGCDIAQGQVVLRKGDRIGPAEIGLLAAVGAERILVRKPPTIAVLSTGDELLEPSRALEKNKIRDSNRSMLMTAIREACPRWRVLDVGIAKDEKDDLEAKVGWALRNADVLVTSGGVSMGELDLLKPVLEGKGQVHFGRVLMKPGKPLTFATVDSDREGEGEGDQTKKRRTLVFALPGNPVSSLVTFYLCCLPALRKLAGYAEPRLPTVQAMLTQDLKLDPERPEYHRVILSWDGERGCFRAVSTGKQASSFLLSCRTSNALLVLPQREGILPAGSFVPAILIGHLLNS